MSTQADQTSGRTVIARAEPQLFVADIKAACEFYAAKLGFSMVFTYGEPPYYGQVKRDRARLLDASEFPSSTRRFATTRNCSRQP